MSKQQGNMYPGVKTWNPLAGECAHGCAYCSTVSLMRFPLIKAKYSWDLRIDEKALAKNLGAGNTWFVCGQNDLFAKEVEDFDILQILRKCRDYDNIYFFQTKNPERFSDYMLSFPEKTILCTTIETNRIYPQMGNTETPQNRAPAMSRLSMFERHVTIEPIFDFDLKEMVSLIKQCKPHKVNIGADSKNHHLPEPSKEKLLALIEELQKFTVIERKTNLKRLLQ